MNHPLKALESSKFFQLADHAIDIFDLAAAFPWWWF